MYLNVHSYFSMGFGTLSPEELVQEAARMGIRRLALTDINNTSGAYPFIRACRKHKIEPVLGIEFRRDQEFLYCGIARTEEGWRNLCAFLTEYNLQQKSLPDRAPKLEDTLFIYRRTVCRPEDFRLNEYLGIRPQEAHRIRNSAWRHHAGRLVAFQSFTFQKEEGFKYREVAELLDISVNTVENQMGKSLKRIRQAVEPYLSEKQQKLPKKEYSKLLPLIALLIFSNFFLG